MSVLDSPFDDVEDEEGGPHVGHDPHQSHAAPVVKAFHSLVFVDLAHAVSKVVVVVVALLHSQTSPHQFQRVSRYSARHSSHSPAPKQTNLIFIYIYNHNT